MVLGLQHAMLARSDGGSRQFGVGVLFIAPGGLFAFVFSFVALFAYGTGERERVVALLLGSTALGLGLTGPRRPTPRLGV